MKRSKLFFGAAIITAMLAAASSAACSNKPQTIDNSTADSLDVPKYMGTWYEIARFDHSFERGMQRVTANYTLNDDGTITVINSGWKENGKFKKAEGKARPVKNGNARQLEVTFFLNFWAPYNILELAPDYSYVLVGSKTDKYLWILSRTPQLPDATLEMLLQKATERGYDTSKLIFVNQN